MHCLRAPEDTDLFLRACDDVPPLFTSHNSPAGMGRPEVQVGPFRKSCKWSYSSESYEYGRFTKLPHKLLSRPV